jgi:hypothetical protein
MRGPQNMRGIWKPVASLGPRRLPSVETPTATWDTPPKWPTSASSFDVVSAGELADVLRTGASAVLADLELDGVTWAEDGEPIVGIDAGRVEEQVFAAVVKFGEPWPFSSLRRSIWHNHMPGANIAEGALGRYSACK